MNIFKLFGSVYIDNEDANKKLEQTKGHSGGLFDSFGKVAVKAGEMAAAIGTAAVSAAIALGTKAVQAASEFEDAFAAVNTLLSDTTDIDAYKQSIIDLSNKTGVSVSELSKAVYQAMSAGVDEAKAVQFAATSLRLAEGGFTDAATAVDILTTAINAYGLSTEEAEALSDKLITTQNLGKTTVNELASSMGKVIPIAAAYGVDIDNLTASYAQLTKGGIGTAEATTYMRQMFTELADNSKEVSKIITEETGSSFAELMEQGYSVADVLQILSDSVDGDTTAFSNLWGSTTAGTGALAILNQGTEAYNETLGAMQESLGATESAYDTMHGTFSAQMELLKNTGENLFITLGEKLMPTIQAIADKVIEYIPVIDEALEGIWPILDQLFQFLEPILLWIIDTVLPKLIEVLGGVVDFIINSAVPWVVEKYEELKSKIEENSDDIKAAWEGMQEAFTRLWQDYIKPICDDIAKIWTETLGPDIEAVISYVTEFATKHMPEISDAFWAVADAVKGVWDDNIKPVFEAFVGWLERDIAPTAKKVFEEYLWPAIQTLGWLISKVWESGIKPVLNSVTSFLTNVFNGDWEAAWQGIVDGFERIWETIKDIAKKPINVVIGFINGMLSGVEAGINGLVNSLNKLQLTVPEWVTNLTGITTFGFNLSRVSVSQIPLLAKGGEATEEGSAIVGEDGAELINLPKGATVTPLNDNNNAFVELGKKLDTLIDLLSGQGAVYLDKDEVGKVLAPVISREIAWEG